MKYDPEIHHRRSIRLKGYDYSQAGAYFVTVCTQGYNCLFGKMENRKIVLNDAGRMVQRVWSELPSHYPGVESDICVIMPNHIHGIIVLVGAGPRACPLPGNNRGIITGQPQGVAPTGKEGKSPGLQSDRGIITGQPQGVAPTNKLEKLTGLQSDNEKALSLTDVVHRFKTMTTYEYIRGVKQHGWPGFSRKFWQRNYYDRIIRDEKELNAIREYIISNPLRWEFDRNNPVHSGSDTIFPE